MEKLNTELRKQGLRIETVDDVKGGRVFTNREFSPGDVVIRATPYVAVLYNGESRCEWCFSDTNLTKCESCILVSYCSSECENSDRKMHIEECKILSKNKILEPSVRFMVKLCIRKKLERMDKIRPTATENFQLVEAMISHMPLLGPEKLQSYMDMAEIVGPIVGSTNMEHIMENFSKLDLNSFGIFKAGDVSTFGSGLYPALSFMSNSCLPDVALSYEGRVAVLRAVERIPNNTEVMINYTEVTIPSKQRQMHLRDKYFFNCLCSYCRLLENPREKLMIEGFRCKNITCEGFSTRDLKTDGLKCQECGCVRSSDEICDISDQIESVSNTVFTSLDSGNWMGAIKDYKRLEKLQLQLYHPTSVIVMETRKGLEKIYLERRDSSKALSYCKKIISALERAYRRSHPSVGGEYYTRGKLELALGQTDAAVRSLATALQVLQRAWGNDAAVVRQIGDTLSRAIERRRARCRGEH